MYWHLRCDIGFDEEADVSNTHCVSQICSIPNVQTPSKNIILYEIPNSDFQNFQGLIVSDTHCVPSRREGWIRRVVDHCNLRSLGVIRDSVAT